MNRKLLAVAVAGAIAPMTAQALDVSVSGQVNRMIRYADDGHDSDVQHLDTTASRSRWRMTAEGELDSGITAGAYIESGFASNRTSAVGTHHKEDVGPDPDFRFSYIYMSGNFGKVTLGHAATAGNGAMWNSHNGAWMGAEYSSAEVASGVQLRTSTGGHVEVPLDKPTHKVVVKDGEPAVETETTKKVTLYSAFGSVNRGRNNILRYDTPSIGPVSLAGSIGNAKDDWSLGASLSQDVGDSSLIAGVIYDDMRFGVSGGLAFANGTSVNLAYGTRDDKDDHQDVYANVAHSWGNTSATIDFRTVENWTPGLDSQSIGLGMNHSLGGGVDVYAGYHHFSFDRADTDIENVSVFHLGSRVRFN